MSKLFYFLLIILLISCTKAEKEIFNLHRGRIFVIGHGGAGFENAYNYLPENSMASLERAIVFYNGDGVEVDVQLTKDNELILFHDDRLETQTSCLGCIRDKNLNELLECRFTKNFTTAVLTDERLISLRNLLEKFGNRNPRPLIFLDIRLFTECYLHENAENLLEVYSDAVLNIITEYNYQEDIFVESASVAFLKKMQAKQPGLKYLIDSSEFDSVLDSVLTYNFYGIVADNRRITKDQVKKAHDHNVNIVMFNVRSRSSNLEAVNKHPDYIQTDAILLLQQILMNK